MSKQNNVNPGQYKVAGREHQGEDIDQNKNKQSFTESETDRNKEQSRESLPGTSRDNLDRDAGQGKTREMKTEDSKNEKPKNREN